MSKQQTTSFIFGLTILALIIGIAVTNSWLAKQINRMSPETKSPTTATSSIPSPLAPISSSSNPSLKLIGTPLDPLAPVRKKNVSEDKPETIKKSTPQKAYTRLLDSPIILQ